MQETCHLKKKVFATSSPEAGCHEDSHARSGPPVSKSWKGACNLASVFSKLRESKGVFYSCHF